MESYESYRNLIEDFLEEKEELLKKLESRGTHPLRIKALKSEIRRCQRVLMGKPYSRRNNSRKPDKEIVPRGTAVKFGNGRLGIVDWNDSATSENFESINYCICPIEFIHMKEWSDHYVWLLREDFEVLKLERYITAEAEIEKIKDEYLDGDQTMRVMLAESYSYLPPEDKFNLIFWSDECSYNFTGR